jgi:hypothetical protein
MLQGECRRTSCENFHIRSRSPSFRIDDLLCLDTGVTVQLCILTTRAPFTKLLECTTVGVLDCSEKASFCQPRFQHFPKLCSLYINLVDHCDTLQSLDSTKEPLSRYSQSNPLWIIQTVHLDCFVFQDDTLGSLVRNIPECMCMSSPWNHVCIPLGIEKIEHSL